MLQFEWRFRSPPDGQFKFAHSACGGHAFLIRMRWFRELATGSIDTMRAVFRNLRSICASGIVSLFVLFLTVSAPHRVHHIFEQSPFPFEHTPSHANDHNADDATHSQGQDHNSPKPLHSDCALQSVAQNTHISSAQLIELPFLEIACLCNADHRIVASSFFDASPFSQRAPPAA